MEVNKENAREALEKMKGVIVGEEQLSLADLDKMVAGLEFVMEFLQAAEKRLPSAASIARDRSRKRSKAKKAAAEKELEVSESWHQIDRGMPR